MVFPSSKKILALDIISKRDEKGSCAGCLPLSFLNNYTNFKVN